MLGVGERIRKEGTANLTSQKFALVRLALAELRKSKVECGNCSAHQLGHPSHNHFIGLVIFSSHSAEPCHFIAAELTSPTFSM